VLKKLFRKDSQSLTVKGEMNTGFDSDTDFNFSQFWNF